MIPCFICGKDIGGGWWTGFPPAPDSQKTGLCAEHDSPENRALAQAAWARLWENSVKNTQDIEAEKRILQQSPFTLVIQFKDGGMATLTALDHSVLTDGDILTVTLPDNEKRFYPLQQIRSYRILSQGRDTVSMAQPALPSPPK